MSSYFCKLQVLLFSLESHSWVFSSTQDNISTQPASLTAPRVDYARRVFQASCRPRFPLLFSHSSLKSRLRLLEISMQLHRHLLVSRPQAHHALLATMPPPLRLKAETTDLFCALIQHKLPFSIHVKVSLTAILALWPMTLASQRTLRPSCVAPLLLRTSLRHTRQLRHHCIAPCPGETYTRVRVLEVALNLARESRICESFEAIGPVSMRI